MKKFFFFNRYLKKYFNINNTIVDAIAERNPDKYGKFTPKTLIPIKSEKEVREMKPDFMIVLPWHFKDEFIVREKIYLDSGGQFIFPLPYLDVVSNYKKILITGATGQIGTYLLKELKTMDKTLLYGVINNSEPTILDKNIFYIKNNLEDVNSIENIIKMLMKYGNENVIYNLCGITDAQISIIDPLRTINLNTILPVRICETILKINKTIKFFQASSSEMYKGHKNVLVDSDTEYRPINPYGISKIASHNFMKYYRDIHNLFTCSGIIFNTESPLRNEKFLSKKITKQIVEIKNNLRENINIGNVNTSRDWIHAYDVATAMIKIIENEKPDDYTISLGKINSVKDFINIAFEMIDIKLLWNENGAYCKKTNKYYITFDEKYKRIYENSNENITGDNKKLLELNWKPKYSLKDIINEMINDNIFN